ncbi:MAG: hypothetical protein HY660_18340 [Armatimonadetes bacterium]|nr:hypothetical protein [Armatimonadota bacterium]
MSWWRLGELETSRGNLDEGLRCLRQGLASGHRTTLISHALPRVYSAMGPNRVEAGQPEEARRLLEEGLAASAQFGECATCKALMHPVAVEVYAALGDLEEAGRHTRLAEDEARRWSSTAWMAMASASAGVLHLAANRPVVFLLFSTPAFNSKDISWVEK